jgi:mono/diheme cytochrome c family protein
MRVRWACLALGLVVITGLPVLAQDGKSTAKSPVHGNSPKLAETQKTGEDTGEQKFQQNCSRCHNAPESFSPRISGTIVKHMRVRASLSDQDAREILRYLNPQ